MGYLCIHKLTEVAMIEYIEKLLNGRSVEWKTLGEVADYEQPTKYLVSSANYNDNYSIPVLTAGKTFILGYTDETTGIYKASLKPVIIFDDFTTDIKWVNFDFKAKSSAMKMITSKSENVALLKFIYYWLCILPKEQSVENHKLHWIGDYSTRSIPIPPLSVQSEIVRILDRFTLLEAELECRRKQYGYYKGQMFDSLSCPTKHITDIAVVKARVGWQRLTKSEYMHTGDYFLVTGTDFKNGYIDFNNCVYVSKERYEMDSNIIVGKGDILITKDGTLGKVAFVTESPNKPTTLNSGIFRIHVTDKDILPRYLFHYFTSKYFTDFVESVKTGSTIPHLTQQGLTSLNIPIPSIEEQLRIVRILDRFDVLTNSISEGLPREIELRRKQYEYYREQLLNFTIN